MRVLSNDELVLVSGGAEGTLILGAGVGGSGPGGYGVFSEVERGIFEAVYAAVHAPVSILPDAATPPEDNGPLVTYIDPDTGELVALDSGNFQYVNGQLFLFVNETASQITLNYSY